MIKRTWTKAEVLDLLGPFAIQDGAGVLNPHVEAIHVIMAIERFITDMHVSNIRKRQDKLKKLWRDEHKFLAIWNGKFDDLTDGCFSCLSNKYQITQVRHSADCSQNCDFCYYRNSPGGTLWTYPRGTYTFSGQGETTPVCSIDEAKLIVKRQIDEAAYDQFGAIGWLQKEPLENPDDIYPLMEYIASLDISQYLYTNGVHASKEVLRRLGDAGLNEIRFNLQSTDFSDKVIERMGIAKEFIRDVCVETPIYSKSFYNFVDKRKEILATGLDQINTPELQSCSIEQHRLFKPTEGLMYKHRRGYISPLSSRHYVYNLIELAEEENWPVVINDCSNDTKYYRGVKGVMRPGIVVYLAAYELPVYDVVELVEEYLEEEKEYEFF